MRLALLASRDKINRTPGDVCYDLLWYSCHWHSHIALPDKIMITLGTLGPFNNSHDSSSCLEKESFALRKKVLPCERNFRLGKKVLSWGRKFCLEKVSFVLGKKVLP